jgi:conjugal transfer ATP-binding protein TraC
MMEKFINFMRTLFADGPTKKEFKNMYNRNRFSEYLPYRAYDETTQTYYNMDDSLGWIWECSPLVYAGKQTCSDLLGLFTAGLPEDTVLQFILYADPNVRDTLDHYASLKTRQDDIVKETTRRTIEFYKNGTSGVDKMSGIPIRNARLFVVLKLKASKNNSKTEVLGYRDNIAETLKGAGLVPRIASPVVLIRWLWTIFNGEYPRHLDYDEGRPINKQIITTESTINTKWEKMIIGKQHVRCQTVKRMAPEIDELTLNYLTGDIWGPRADGNQINTPFLFTMNVIFKNMNAALHAKTNLVLKQQIAGSVANSLQKKRDEYLWASGELDRGAQFVKVQPIIWHFAKTEEESRETSARIKRIWDAKGFVTQEDQIGRASCRERVS